MLKLLVHIAIAIVLTLFSTFVGERSAAATYADIMGCETGCRVVDPRIDEGVSPPRSLLEGVRTVSRSDMHEFSAP